MATWSKIFSERSCMEIAHPWTENCLRAGVDNFIASFVGSAGFFTILYLCQYASTVMKKKKKVSIKDFMKTLLYSTLFGASDSAVTLSSSCLIRKILGRYYYYTMVLIPGLIGGCSIFMTNQRNREFFTNAFANCALELWIKQLQKRKILNWTPTTQTITFMVLSSFLSTLLSSSPYDGRYFWFFQPPKISKKTENVGVCFHEEDCRKHIFNLFVMYSTTGVALQLVKIFITNIKTPKLILSSLRTPKTFKLAAFLGGYVVAYQALRCFLYQRERKYSWVHDTISGFLAGTAFRFQPNLPILNSAIINIIQILTEIGCRRKMLPNIPYLEMVFAISSGLLFHSRIMLSEQCPQLMVYIMSTITHGRADAVTKIYENILSKSKLTE